MDEMQISAYLILGLCLLCFIGMTFNRDFGHPRRYNNYIKALQNCTNNARDVDYCRAQVTLYYQVHGVDYGKEEYR